MADSIIDRRSFFTGICCLPFLWVDDRDKEFVPYPTPEYILKIYRTAREDQMEPFWAPYRGVWYYIQNYRIDAYRNGKLIEFNLANYERGRLIYG